MEVSSKQENERKMQQIHKLQQQQEWMNQFDIDEVENEDQDGYSENSSNHNKMNKSYEHMDVEE